MNICFVSDAGSSHTKKWCKWFVEHNHKVSVISFTPGYIDGVNIRVVETRADPRGNELGKIKYFSAINKVKRILNEQSPDVVSVHYATSYGLIVALTGYKNYVLSVWGSDIYTFPRKSFIHKIVLKFSLSCAGYIFSTSDAMAKEARKYTKKNITVTPFGVDTGLFSPDKKNVDNVDKKNFIVGTVKTLTPKYGIDYLIKAVAMIRRNNPEIPIQLRIAGKGEYEKNYKKLAKDCEIDNITTWLGFISQEQAAYEWANMDVAVIASTLDSESFGVSAVEAESCGTAVIITDIPGLMEATLPQRSSIVVSRKNEKALADAIVQLYYNAPKRKKMGKTGREYVIEKYSIDRCFGKIESIFKSLVKQ